MKLFLSLLSKRTEMGDPNKAIWVWVRINPGSSDTGPVCATYAIQPDAFKAKKLKFWKHYQQVIKFKSQN